MKTKRNFETLNEYGAIIEVIVVGMKIILYLCAQL